MRAVAVLIAALVPTVALTACAAPMEPTTGGPPPMTQNGNDCAVIAAVAKEHYRFNDSDRLPPPLWLDDEGSGWAPRCDWSSYGLRFPTTFHPDRRPQPQRVQWVSFKQPRYDGAVAVIESGILHGPLAGMGIECTVRSGFAGWTVEGQCRNTWIS